MPSAAQSRRAQRRFAVGERLAQLAALGGERRHQLGEALLGEHSGRRPPAPRRDRARLPARAAAMTCSAASISASRGAALVDHGEFRRHPGLERKAAQQRLAEGVDRRDLGAARRVEHAGEELPGAGDLVLRSGSARSARPVPAASAPAGMVVHSASRSLSRLAISAAAARVKVRHRMRAGSVPSSISVSRRSVSTLVLPVPAEAETQTEASGVERLALRDGRAAVAPSSFGSPSLSASRSRCA